MSGVTTRDALATVLLKHGHAEWDEFDARVVADALLASGAVIDAATLAEDETLVREVGATTFPGWHGIHGRVEVRTVLRGLASYLSERTS